MSIQKKYDVNVIIRNLSSLIDILTTVWTPNFLQWNETTFNKAFGWAKYFKNVIPELDGESKRQLQKHLTFLSKQRHLKYIISVSSLLEASHYLFEHILKSYYLSTLQTSTDSFLFYSFRNILANANEVNYIRQCLIKCLSQNLYYNNQIQILMTILNQVINSNSIIHTNSEIFNYLLNSHTILLRSYGKLLYNHLKQLLIHNNDKLEDYLKKYICNDSDCIEIILWSYYYTNNNEDMLLFQKLTPFVITYIYYVIESVPVPLISIIILHNPSLFVKVFDMLNSNEKQNVENKNRLRTIIDCVIVMCHKNKNVYYKILLPQFKSIKNDDSLLLDLIYSLSV